MIDLTPALAARPAPWTRLDLLALGAARGWIDGAAMVAVLASRPVVHAIGQTPFDATAALLAEVAPQLPERLELRVGPAAAGVLARTHHLTMLGPYVRLHAPAPADLPDPVGLRPLRPSDHAQVIRLADGHHDLDPAWLGQPGWLGVEVQGSLVAAAGPLARGASITLIAPPRLSRSARRTPVGAALLAALTRALPGRVVLDVRLDRRDRVALAERAGFASMGTWERWWAERR